MVAQPRLIAVGALLETQIDPVKLAEALSEALGTPISATLPVTVMEKMDQLERGIEGVELRPEDFDTQTFIDPEDLSAASTRQRLEWRARFAGLAARLLLQWSALRGAQRPHATPRRLPNPEVSCRHDRQPEQQ